MQERRENSGACENKRKLITITMKTKTNCLYLLILVVIQGFAVNGVPLHEALHSIKDYKRSLTTDGWFIGSNGKQYQLTKNENGFYETGDVCQAIGGDLVTINNVKDQEAVNEFVTASQLKNGRYFWIGLHEGSSRVGAPWIWEKTNQLATHFLNWAPEQPISHDALNDCGAIGVDGTWFSRNCDMKLVGICEKQAAPGNGNAQSGQSTSGTSTEKPKEAPKTTENVVAQIPATQDNATEGIKVSPNGNQGAQAQVNANQEAAVTEEMKKKFNNGERCNLVNFINHIGKPVIISRRVNDRLKEYIVEGENYKMNTLFKKVENVLKMEPVVYSARESGDGRKRLALDGLDSLTLMPGDCDGDFVDVIISPRSIEKAMQRCRLSHLTSSVSRRGCRLFCLGPFSSPLGGKIQIKGNVCTSNRVDFSTGAAVFSEFKSINYENKGRVAHISLNRPERLNAIDLKMPEEIEQAVKLANSNEDIRVILLSGNGDAFCSGYDLKIFAEGERGKIPGSQSMPWDPYIDYKLMSACTSSFMSLWRSLKPVVCKIHGYAVAGGSDIALCCDICVMADDAMIGYPPARLWGCPTTAMWVYRIGAEMAKKMLFTGDLINGTEAKMIGLVSESVPLDKLKDKTDQLVARISTVPTNQLFMQKQLVNNAVEQMGLLQTQRLAILFDGMARHTPEGVQFQNTAHKSGFKQALNQRERLYNDINDDDDADSKS